jgi:hypothetical protein
MRFRIPVYAGSVVAVAAATLMMAAPANADVYPFCGENDGHCIFWGQNYDGSMSTVVGDVPNFPVSGSTQYTFQSSGTGQGQRIGNNNGSDANYDLFCQVKLWYSPNYAGPSVTLTQEYSTGWARHGSELGSLLNNIRSQQEINCQGD